MRISLIVAVAKNGVIGRDGGLPWRLSSDLRRFKAITMSKPVIMGRKTWDSLPIKPLPGRLNIVVTRQREFHAPGAMVAADPDAALALARGHGAEECLIIGGGELYRQMLPRADRLHLTEVDLEAQGDTRLPAIDESQWREVAREVGVQTERDSAPFTYRVLDRLRIAQG